MKSSSMICCREHSKLSIENKFISYVNYVMDQSVESVCYVKNKKNQYYITHIKAYCIVCIYVCMYECK